MGPKRMRILFILAGYPSSGKSTLLMHALRNEIPLFGVEYSQLFLNRKIATGANEGDPSLKKLKDGLWFTTQDLDFLSKRRALPNGSIFHLDLLLAVLLQQPIVPLLSDERYVSTLINRYCAHSFFAKFDEVICNTLCPEWDVVARQNRIRNIASGNVGKALGPIFSVKNALLDETNPRKDTYSAIITAWLHGSLAARSKFSFISSWDQNGRLQIRRHEVEH
jgi:hypothetical protein